MIQNNSVEGVKCENLRTPIAVDCIINHFVLVLVRHSHKKMVEIKRSSQFSDDLVKSLFELRSGSDLIDVTLVSGDGTQFGAHKVVLAASSLFFKSILTSFNQTHLLFYLRGVSSSVLGQMLEFLYEGKVSLPENEISEFLSFAKEINLNGLQEEFVAERHQDTVVYLPKELESKSKLQNVADTKVEYISEVDKKLLHIFQAGGNSCGTDRTEEKSSFGDLSQNTKWLKRVRSQQKFCNFEGCDYVTNDNSKLRRHKEVKHDLERREPIVCKTIACGKRFKTSSEFKDHREKCFMTCPSNACNSKFTIPESLEVHRRKHELGEIKEHRFLLKKAENPEASLKRIWDVIQKT